MTPQEYLLIKDMLVRESLKEGIISQNFLDNTFKIDKERLTGVFDFLASENMIVAKTL